ncbi:unnamed protein product [Fusarium graminearum]|uniref:F-box domain-containing protein n=4 Tax=Gibberella zeae TaxID=5518 RepID=I1RBP4_GIBZE|nr:hypothetical protein FGSG_00975 [Fusarium graminearum PH-1]ESU06233.1 hypothetical protein FGSG_00975 [Fusarium graminearum PH-1]CZS76294.1 unnamed protein product [Fusarium graminearum]|eukprot:XP_011316718.1 hypothetical protein FGSG_00975 [Fusarium graminearum PH-1]
MAMFQVQHNHHGEDFHRFFHRGRSSMSAIDDRKAEEFRRHVWAVTMIDEEPAEQIQMQTQTPAQTQKKKLSRRSTDLVRPGANKLRSKRSSVGPPPVTRKGNDKHSKSQLSLDLTMKDTTVSVRPVHPTMFGSPKTSQETAISAFLANTSTIVESPKTNQAPFSPDDFPRPTYTVLETPLADPKKSRDAISQQKPNINRPRQLSNISATTLASLQSQTINSPTMKSSWGNRPSMESTDSASKWRPEYMYQRPMPIKNLSSSSTRTPMKPNELFAKLPTKVLSNIMEQLRNLHVGENSGSCATCWMRDATNVAVSCRKWYQPAQAALYGNIQLVGADSAVHKKKYKMSQGVRVIILRRTLRSKPRLASLVRTLKVPAPETVPKGSTIAEYEDLIATLVMACPNLESLRGLSPMYDHSFSKIFHALSTRSNLKEMNWLIQASPHQTQQRTQGNTQQPGMVMPGELKPFQEATFLSFNANWSRLESLTVHCLPGATLTPETLLTKTLERLPNIKHLHLCNLPPNSFDDCSLLTLPPLETLTLSHISGITTAGLSAFATQSNSYPLRKLTLRHTPMNSLAALARILSNLRNLVNFSFIQAFPPTMPENDSFTLWLMPYLTSNTIRKLHWDITSHATCVNAADDILARSIGAGGFPALRILRTPNDPDGIFQELCYPVERIDLPCDRFRSTEQPEVSTPPPSSTPSPMSPTRLFRSTNASPIASPREPISPFAFPFGDSRRAPYSNLHTSRLAAQARLEAARSQPKFTVNVIEEDGTFNDTFTMAGFIGTAGSPIKYHLHPDRGTTDDKGGLIDIRDLESDAGENLAGGKAGCNGRWNSREGIIADKKEKEWWWHTERGRWTKVTL